MRQRCPVCGQTLPEGMDAAEIDRQLEKIGAAEADKVRRELTDEYSQQLAKKEAELSNRAKKDAQAAVRAEIKTLQRRVQESERNARKEADKERDQHAKEKGRLQKKIEDLLSKLEHRTSEEKGEMGEAEVYAALKAAFPSDVIERIAKGMNGADILQKVIQDGKEVGRIVYECKNASTWQNEWIVKAKRYRVDYQTPWVVIAARTLPHGEKSFVVEKGVPVVNFGLTASLAEIVREAVGEIGQLRSSRHDGEAKAVQMFEYILSDHFISRFKGFAESIAALREHQSKERQWHSEAWSKQTRYYDEMENERREIAARMLAIAETPMKPILKVVGGA
ncbi:MAG: DUF2130 domain-containing protein [Candidatus Binatia bacterium]